MSPAALTGVYYQRFIALSVSSVGHTLVYSSTGLPPADRRRGGAINGIMEHTAEDPPDPEDLAAAVQRIRELERELAASRQEAEQLRIEKTCQEGIQAF